jgi:hypothetical protein
LVLISEWTNATDQVLGELYERSDRKKIELEPAATGFSGFRLSDDPRNQLPDQPGPEFFTCAAAPTQ